jgi:hypothetical protein
VVLEDYQILLVESEDDLQYIVCSLNNTPVKYLMETKKKERRRIRRRKKIDRTNLKQDMLSAVNYLGHNL